MADQLFSDGDVIQPTGSVQLECSAVSYQENPETQEHYSFVYHFRLKSEMDAEREAAKEAAENAAASDELTASIEAEQPKPLEEETQHVR